MVKKGSTLFLVLFFTLLSSVSLVYAGFNDCFEFSGGKGGNQTVCEANSCLWTTNLTDSFCDDPQGCCIDTGCFNFDGTNQSFCENATFNPLLNTSNYNLSCEWDSFGQVFYPNGSAGPMGLCNFNCSGGDCDDHFGGIESGCWQNDGDKDQCTSNSQCSWSANGQNQNPWCWIKNLGDAQDKNPLATSLDIGCCEQKGCWLYDGNQTQCEGVYGGLCWYDQDANLCNPKWCGEVTTQDDCNSLKTQFFMPCNWTGSACVQDSAFYKGDSDSCFDSGGWYNESGDCITPSDEGGNLFGGFQAACWFADDLQTVCGNITGCVYCNATNIANSTSACYQEQANLCQGHQNDLPNALDIATDSLVCSDIKIRSACKFGPLNCFWNNSNSSIITGDFCAKGTGGQTKQGPPVTYCEDPQSKNNYTLCMQLKNTYLMPCKWDNSSYPAKNCTFNNDAVFGSSGKKDFFEISSESACQAAGGEWTSEFYVESGVLKQDSWCEVAGFFDISTGQGSAGVANCDDSCWACEFQSNGTRWSTQAAAEAACGNSKLGYCEWENNSNAFNGQGFCNYPPQVSQSGAGGCNVNCGDCDFANSPQTACENSVANNGQGCQWVNDSEGGFCSDKGKKSCTNDCFSCFSESDCGASSLDCTWDNNGQFCKPSGFNGEVCFDAVDNDGDFMVDCADPDCSFDNFCGGSKFGGDCFAQTEATCNITEAFNGLNCTWINDTWNPAGWCDMPGAQCWQFDDDLQACGQEPGCTNSSNFQGGFCDVNFTTEDAAGCENFEGNYTGCLAQSNCSWVNHTFGGGGYCDWSPFATCEAINNVTGCNANAECIWHDDPFGEGGFCDVACFNESFNNDAASCNAVAGSLCSYRNLNETCQPEAFQIFSSGSGGKTGCYQFDGNETGCNSNNITCSYQTDPLANNNVTASDTSGWCMDKAEFEHFSEIKGDVIDLAFDMNNSGGSESGIDPIVDLTGLGMRVTDDSFNFGAGVYNISDGAICNGYPVRSFNDEPGSNLPTGVGIETTKFYWYLDTDGNSSNGCNAVGQYGNDTGYDFLISFVSKNTSSGITSTKQLKRCSSGTWINTNVLITTSKQLSCSEIGGVMVAVEIEGLDSFAAYNETALMRIFMSSANATDTRLSPSDSVGPGYYYPGTVDFDFVDCSDPDVQNAKCKNVQKYGFNIFEECKNGVDDDENGLVDCADPMCSFLPQCAGTGFNFSIDPNDKIPPVVSFSEVEELYDGAFIRVDTNGPSNMSVKFYRNDSDCSSLNTTVSDTGQESYQQNANYKPFHTVDLLVDNLGYALTNGTTYYYKTKVCDPSNNCATSKCLNFTTESDIEDSIFIFKIDLPDNYTVDIPAFNKTGYNFTEVFGGTRYEVGIKTNTSVTKNMNFTINCGNMSIGFFGINILEPTKIDLSSAFVCNPNEGFMGMNSTLKKWNELIDDLRLGGANDYIEITLPEGYELGNDLNWSDDFGNNDTNVTEYVNCTGNSTETTCKVPVSMGFSTYSISTASDSGSENNNNNDNSGSGGGGATGGSVIVIITPEDFEKGYTRSLQKGSQFRVLINDAYHYIKVNNITSTQVILNITSDPVIVALGVGEEKAVDVDGDSLSDLKVKLESLTTSYANLTVTQFTESLLPTDGSPSDTTDTTSTGSTTGAAVDDSPQTTGSDTNNNRGILLLLIVIVLVVLVAVLFFFKDSIKRLFSK